MMKMGFVRGALLGLLAGFLVAPRSGKETRDNIKKHYEEIAARVAEELCRLKEISSETYAQVVGSVVRGFEQTKKITAKEAKAIVQELKGGYEEVRRSHEKEAKVAAKR